MRHVRDVTTLAVVLFAVVLALSAPAVRAHEQESFVDWEVGYANLNFLSAPVFIEQKNAVRHVGQVDAGGNYATISLDTGDVLRIDYGFQYLGLKERRGDLTWTTRLGLDFGTIGRYVNATGSGLGKWIGGGSFALIPGHFYNATLVLRTLQPTFRHLHVAVSVQDVGNLVAAPTVIPIPAGGPTLYGIFTDAKGPVVEPLQGYNVPPFGTLKLLEPWPWAVGGLVAQIVIGLSFIGIMYWYGKWETKRQSKGGAGA